MKREFFKKFRLLFIALALLLAVALFIPLGFAGGGAEVAAAAESSDHFNIKDTNVNYDKVEKIINVHDKKILDVTEYITVTFKQSGINVGLTRNISRKNKITRIVDGKTYVKSTVNKLNSWSVRIKNDGANIFVKEYAFTETDSDYFYILTGADYNYKEAGTYTYEIKYEYDMGDDLISEFDDFTFDIMDYGFRSPVDEFEATVTMPFEFLGDKDISEVLTFRTNEMAPLTYEQVHATYDEQTFTITCSYTDLGKQRPNGGYRSIGLTMQLILPQGYYHTYFEPSALYKGALAACVISVVGIAAVILIMRYRKKPVVVTEFYAPDNLSPMDVARIYRGKVMGKDFASLVIHWASMGLVSIQLNGKRDVILTKLKPYPGVSSKSTYINEDFDGEPSKAKTAEKKWTPATRYTKHERDYFNALFSTTNVFDSKVSKHIYKDMTRARKIGKVVPELTKSEPQQKRKTVIARVIITILSTIPFILTMLWSSQIDSGALPIFFIVLFPLIALNVFLYVPMPLWFKLIWCAGFGGAPLAILLMNMSMVYDIWYLSIISIVIFFAGHISGLFVRVYPKDNEEKLGRILGFKDFLLYAELDKLNERLEANPDYYYDILPYCYVFGITKKMEKRFSALNIPAHLPDYFEGHTATTICHCMTSSMRHIGGGFSSSGGGFSSGGGHGGGGGGGGGSSGGGGGGGGCGGR